MLKQRAVESVSETDVVESSAGMLGWALAILESWSNQPADLALPSSSTPTSTDHSRSSTESLPAADDGKQAVAAESVEESQRRPVEPKPQETAASVIESLQELEARRRQLERREEAERAGKQVVGVVRVQDYPEALRQEWQEVRRDRREARE